MKIGRRSLILLAGVVALGAVAVAVAFALGRDEDDIPKLPGRIAVRDGCGLTHMWIDATDQRELCLPNVWAAVSVSPNGERLAWDTGTGIQIANAEGANPASVPLPPGANFDPSLSPDGDKIAFLHSPRDDGRYDLWVGSTSVDNAEQLTNTRNISTLAWSPTGEWIAYVRGWSQASLEGEIVLIRPNAEDETILARGDTPTWSPDGSRLAFAHAGSIWGIDADGSDLKMLIRDGEAPAWSRDGTLIAFMREVRCEELPCQRVFVAGADGGTVRGLGPTYTGTRFPVWLPDPFE